MLEYVKRLCALASIPKLKVIHAGSSLKQTKSVVVEDLLEEFKGQNVIFLSRRIEDTLVSAYHQAKYRINVFDGTFDEFLYSEKLGAPRLLSYYEIWSNLSSQCERFTHIRYEEMHADANAVLTGALKIIGIKEPNEAHIQQAVVFCKFRNLQALERNHTFGSTKVQARDTDDLKTYKFRSGKIGGYKDYFSEDNITYLSNLIQRNDSPLVTSALKNPDHVNN